MPRFTLASHHVVTGFAFFRVKLAFSLFGGAWMCEKAVQNCADLEAVAMMMSHRADQFRVNSVPKSRHVRFCSHHRQPSLVFG